MTPDIILSTDQFCIYHDKDDLDGDMILFCANGSTPRQATWSEIELAKMIVELMEMVK